VTRSNEYFVSAARHTIVDPWKLFAPVIGMFKNPLPANEKAF